MKWAVEIWGSNRTEHKAAILQTDDIYSAIKSIKNEFCPYFNRTFVRLKYGQLRAQRRYV